MPKLLPPNINPAFEAAVRRMLGTGTAAPRKKAVKKARPKKNGVRS